MLAIIWTLFGVCLLGMYNGLLILDNRTPDEDPKNKEISDDWHITGALIFLYLGFTAWFLFGIEYVPFVISMFWCVFAGIVHRVGLSKPFFFVGTTAKTDKLIRKYFPKNPEKGSMIAKLAAVGLSLLLIMIF